jgi:hypothetical protein
MKNTLYHIKHVNNRFLSFTVTSWHSYFQSMIHQSHDFVVSDLKENVLCGKRVDDSRNMFKSEIVI